MMRTAVAFVCVTGLVVAFVGLRLHGDAEPLRGAHNVDMPHYFLPSATFLHDALERGELPLWNPYQMAGQPFAAQHVPAGLYPPNLLLLRVFEPARALAVHFAFHLVVAGGFLWLLCMRLGSSPLAAAAAAGSFTLSGPIVFGAFMPSYLSTEAWLPALLWGVHGLVTQGGARWMLASAGSAALAFLGGHAQVFVFEVQLAAIFGAGVWWSSTPRVPVGSLIGQLAWAGLLALGGVAPQLFPAVEVASDAVRSFDGHDFASAAYWSVDPGALLRGWLGPWATDADVVPMSQQLPGHDRWLFALPVLALPLALVGGWLRRDACWWLFAGSFAFSGLFALGEATPVFAAYFSLPLGDWFRGPMRIGVAYAASASVLLAFGVEALRSRWHGSRLGTAAVVALVAWVWLDGFARTTGTFQHPIRSEPQQGAPADLVDFLAQQNDRPRLFVQNPFGLPHEALRMKFGMMNGVFAFPDYAATVPAAYERFFDPAHRQPWHATLDALKPLSGRTPQQWIRLFDLLSVRYYAVIDAASPETVAALRELAGGTERKLGRVRVFERESAVPRAFAVRRVSFARDAEAFAQRIVQPDFRPLLEAVIVGSPANRSQFAALTGPTPAPEANRDTAQIAEYERERVRVDANCAAPCLLVLTDLDYPGWRASVGGAEYEVHTVNGLVRGVVLEPGRHSVEFRFESASYRWGLSLAACAGLGALATAVVARRYRV
jgi:hypothetical protein